MATGSRGAKRARVEVEDNDDDVVVVDAGRPVRVEAAQGCQGSPTYTPTRSSKTTAVL